MKKHNKVFAVLRNPPHNLNDRVNTHNLFSTKYKLKYKLDRVTVRHKSKELTEEEQKDYIRTFLKDLDFVWYLNL